MRVAVIGGTGFIGRAIVADLDRAGHAVLVTHRGERAHKRRMSTLTVTTPARWRLRWIASNQTCSWMGSH